MKEDIEKKLLKILEKNIISDKLGYIARDRFKEIIKAILKLIHHGDKEI